MSTISCSGRSLGYSPDWAFMDTMTGRRDDCKTNQAMLS